MKTIQEKQDQIVQEFSKFSDWEERYKHIIQLGKSLSPLDEEYKAEKNRVKGCQSQTWLHAYLDGSKIMYQADSDAMIVRGLVAILLNVFSDQTPQDVLAAKLEFLTQIGLTTHLTQSRANGLAALAKQFKNYAVAFDVLLKSQNSAK